MREHALLAFGARVVGDHDLDLRADDPPDHRVGDARVAGRAVQHGLARLEPAVVQRPEKHAQHRPVLERPPGIQRLHLREHLDLRELAVEDIERDEWGVAHGPQRGVALDERLDARIPRHRATISQTGNGSRSDSIVPGKRGADPVLGRLERRTALRGELVFGVHGLGEPADRDRNGVQQQGRS